MTHLHRAACLVFVAACAASYPIAELRSDVGTWTVVQYGVAALAMGAAWWAHQGCDKRAVRRLMVAGLVARLVLVPVAPYTSNDAERYLWDGRVALESVDPYRVAPDSASVRHLREDWPTPAEHTSVVTLYPPGALAGFALAAAAGPTWAPAVWKVACALASVALLLVSLALLRLYGRSAHLALVALSPILVLEAGIGAHVDVFSALAAVGAVLAFGQRREGLAGALIGVGALVKLLPAVLLLPLAVASAGRPRWRMAFAAGATLGLGYLAAFGLGLRPIGSLGHFFAHWRFGSPLASIVEAALPPAWSSLVLPGLLVIGLAAVAHVARRAPLRAIQASLWLPLLTSPVVFPWYLCTLVPVVALAPTAFLMGWLVVHPLTYEVLDGFLSAGGWNPRGWPVVAIGLAWFGGLAWDRVRIPLQRA